MAIEHKYQEFLIIVQAYSMIFMMNPVKNEAIEKKYKPVNASVNEWTTTATASNKTPTIVKPTLKGLEFEVVICNFL